MSDVDRTAFAQKVAEMFDDQIIALLSINSSHYRTEALEIARAEAERRGIFGDVQKVEFDVFLNSAGFAGRMILLEEQLMFLSTGMAAANNTAGVVGAIVGNARISERSVAASQLDFSALDTEGSWIYFLDQIKDCKADSKFLSGPELQFVIEDEGGNVLNGVVNCGDLSRDQTEELARSILRARDELAATGAVGVPPAKAL